MSEIKAVAPAAEYHDAFLRMLDDFDRLDPDNGEYYADARRDFNAYVESLRCEERGVDLPEGFVPCSHRWLLLGNDIVGNVRVRHNIDTPMLATEHGHIGYDVPPSMRGRGYGVATLRAGLDVARNIGLDRVLLFADADNPASWRTIERCGGILEVERLSEHYSVLVRRYWIEVH